MANKNPNGTDRLDEILFSVAREANDALDAELDAVRIALTDMPRYKQKGSLPKGLGRYASIAAALVLTISAALAIFNPPMQQKQSQPDTPMLAAADTGSAAPEAYMGEPQNAAGSADAARSQNFTASLATEPPDDNTDYGADTTIIIVLGTLSADDMDALNEIVSVRLKHAAIDEDEGEITVDFGGERETGLKLRFADEDLGYLELSAGEAMIQTVDEAQYLAIWRISEYPAEYLYIEGHAIELEKFEQMLYNIVAG